MAGHPGTLPLRLYRGDSYAWQVRLWSDADYTLPTDLTGATAAGSIAATDGVMDLDCTVTLPNVIDVNLAAAEWNGVTNPTRWDLQLSWDDGRVYTLLAGGVTVQDDVTP